MRLPLDMSTDDVHQWLNGCWVEYCGEVYKYYSCEHADEDSDEFELLLTDDGVAFAVDPWRVDVRWPMCGAVNVEELGALYVQRTARRQWRRGYTSRCLELFIPNEWSLIRTSNKLTRLSVDHKQIVRACFFPEYPHSFTRAMELLDSRPSVALDHRTIVCRLSGGRRTVYYNGTKAGDLIPDGNHWQVEVDDTLIRRRLEKMTNG